MLETYYKCEIKLWHMYFRHYLSIYAMQNCRQKVECHIKGTLSQKRIKKSF